MCAIVDTNVAPQVFGSQPTDAGEGFFRWLNRGKGKLVVGGRLKEELEQISNYCRWAQQATLSGKLVNKDKTCVDEETEKVRSSGKLKSDDPHIIALAQVSGARLLFSNDKHLKDDFKNLACGKVYSTLENKNFTRRKKKLLEQHRCRVRN